MDHYKTIQSDSEGSFKDRGSKFIGVARPVKSREEAEQLLGELRKEHFKARHHCLAYRIGLDEIEERGSDDGEPSGSAGMPILNQLRSEQLNNIAIVVVRYFGGTKLGVSGLINAYREAAAQAIMNATTVQKDVRYRFQLTFDYKIMNEVMSVSKSDFLECTRKDLGVKGLIEFGILPSELETSLNHIMAQLHHLPLEAVEDVIYEHDLYELKSLGKS